MALIRNMGDDKCLQSTKIIADNLQYLAQDSCRSLECSAPGCEFLPKRGTIAVFSQIPPSIRDNLADFRTMLQNIGEKHLRSNLIRGDFYLAPGGYIRCGRTWFVYSKWLSSLKVQLGYLIFYRLVKFKAHVEHNFDSFGHPEQSIKHGPLIPDESDSIKRDQSRFGLQA
jgi:hypothetical protein